jgi:hypothetical protein
VVGKKVVCAALPHLFAPKKSEFSKRKHFACSLLPEDFPCRWSVPRTTQVAYYLLSAHKKMFAKNLVEVSSPSTLFVILYEYAVADILLVSPLSNR